jgi:hypothetical protein
VSDLPHLPAGVYQHHKGPLYLVLGYGHDANYPDRDVVVYVGLQLDEAKTGPRLAVRTVQDFCDEVCTNPRCVRFGGLECIPQHYGARFRYLSPTYEGENCG